VVLQRQEDATTDAAWMAARKPLARQAGIAGIAAVRTIDHPLPQDSDLIRETNRAEFATKALRLRLHFGLLDPFPYFVNNCDRHRISSPFMRTPRFSVSIFARRA
jgi:hypothetical protein